MVVLLVDDDVQIQFFISQLLQADGFTVLTACNGEAALEASRNYPARVDLLLTDVEMPRMNGLELCRIVAAERPGIKVLMMSGDPKGSERVSMHGLPFVQKPFSPKVLRASIESSLDCDVGRAPSPAAGPLAGLVGCGDLAESIQD